jgi:secreted Zn-dependent insulinase-like peptidase
MEVFEILDQDLEAGLAARLDELERFAKNARALLEERKAFSTRSEALHCSVVDTQASVAVCKSRVSLLEEEYRQHLQVRHHSKPVVACSLVSTAQQVTRGTRWSSMIQMRIQTTS